MPSLPTFSMPSWQKRRTKGIKSPGFLSSSTSHSSFGLGDVFDIHATASTSTGVSSGGSIAESFIQAAPGPQNRVSVSPKVRLNFSSRDLSDHDVADWLPEHLLADSEVPPPEHSPESAYSNASGQDRDNHSDDDEESVYDQDSAHSSPADVLAHLEALDASSFVTYEGDDDYRVRTQAFHKRPAPAPIKIPNGAFTNSKVQIVTSAQSRSQSYVSEDASASASAVSGTTLARALIGNSYVLSSDNRNKYRSGASVLSRQDSATLPTTDYYFNSPYSEGASPGDFPLPSNAESVYLPPKVHRHEGLDVPDSGRWPNSKKRTSAGSIKVGSELESESSSDGLRRSNNRIPDIPEVPTPRSVTSFEHELNGEVKTGSDEPLTPTSADPVRSGPDRRNGSPLPAPPSPSPSAAPSAAPTASPKQSPIPSDAPSSAKSLSSSRSLENMLDYYSDDYAPMPTVPLPPLPPPLPDVVTNFRPMLSPLSEESASQLSPGSRSSLASGPLRTGDSMNSMSSLASRSLSIQNGSSGSSEPSPSSQLTRISSLGMGGERTRLSQAISLPRQRGEAAPSTLATLVARDTGDTLAPPSVSAVFNRQRSGSAPSPIKVVRDSKDETSYNITVSPGIDTNDSVPMPSSATDSDAGQQTFPETPNGFSPTWSAAATSAGLNQDGHMERALPSLPQTPQSAALPTAHASHNLAQQVLLSRASTAVVRGGRPPSMLAPRQSISINVPVLSVPQHDPLQEVDEEDDGEPTPPSNRENAGRHHHRDSTVTMFTGTSPARAALPLPRPETETTDAEPDTSVDHSVPTFDIPSVMDRPFAGHTETIALSQTAPITPPGSGGAGSPPSYYAAIYDGSSNSAGIPTPSTGGSTADGESRYTFAPNTPPTGRRRVRPPGPMGPRRPSYTALQATAGTVPSLMGPRQRNGSISSITSIGLGRQPSYTPQNAGVRFQTVPVRWRGYTIDQAKWTFTSAQLQTIVSRAIKQSADGTKIRLLPLEALDNDMPNELRQLELRRTDIQTKYRIQSRNRTNMFSSLSYAIAEGVDLHEADSTLRLVNELKDVTVNLDQLTEELHSVDEQIAQLHSLNDVHSASALAMALRKLNSSFLRQAEDIKTLQEQLTALTVERDDAWRYAESEASKYDRLTKSAEASEASSSNRNSRMSAARKSSIRASRSGLRNSYAASRRSSVSSNNRLSISVLSGTKSTFSADDAPPVPPIPRRPFAITTDLPTTRTSMGFSSTSGFTPTSETRAMHQAQDDLYEMLGFNPNGHRRALSFNASGPTDKDPVLPGPPSLDQLPEHPPRPASLPGPSELKESSMHDADREAMLKTLEMLSSE